MVDIRNSLSRSHISIIAHQRSTAPAFLRRFALLSSNFNVLRKFLLFLMLPILLLRYHELQDLLEYRIDILILFGAAVCKTPVASDYALGLLIGNLFCV